jgi:hypothetical protein
VNGTMIFVGAVCASNSNQFYRFIRKCTDLLPHIGKKRRSNDNFSFLLNIIDNEIQFLCYNSLERSGSLLSIRMLKGANRYKKEGHTIFCGVINGLV